MASRRALKRFNLGQLDGEAALPRPFYDAEWDARPFYDAERDAISLSGTLLLCIHVFVKGYRGTYTRKFWFPNFLRCRSASLIIQVRASSLSLGPSFKFPGGPPRICGTGFGWNWGAAGALDVEWSVPASDKSRSNCTANFPL